MSLAGEIADFAREYFDAPQAHLTPDTDLAALFGSRDPDFFCDFIEDVGKRFGIKLREMRDMIPGAEERPTGILRMLVDAFFQKTDMEALHIERLTISDLCDFAEAGAWPERLIKPRSKIANEG